MFFIFNTLIFQNFIKRIYDFDMRKIFSRFPCNAHISDIQNLRILIFLAFVKFNFFHHFCDFLPNNAF